MLKTVEDRRTNKVPEIPLPLSKLNEGLWGLNRKEVMVIGARPGECKSSLAMNFAYHAAKSGKHVEYLSLEMSVPSLLMRLASHDLQIPHKDIRSGQLASLHLDRLVHFHNQLDKLPLYFSHDKGYVIEEVSDLLLAGAGKIDVLIIDYLQNIRKPPRFTIDVYDDYMHSLFQLAHEYNISVIVCSQINRSIKDNPDKYPTKENLKGAGSIEETADVILLNHWPWKWETMDDVSSRHSIHEFMLIVEKNRNGETWAERVFYEPSTFTFQDWSVMATKPL